MAGDNLNIGIIGLDTSHVVAFTELLHKANHEHHVSGGRVVAAYPGGSADFALSHSRVEGFTTQLRNEFGVKIVDSIGDVAELADAILLESVDGRVHLEQLRQVVEYRKPVFLDKPFAVTSSDAEEMIRLAREFGTPLMSASAVGYSEALTSALGDESGGSVTGCDTFGPMAIEPTQPGLFWYGIHCVEALFAVLGPDCVSVRATTNEKFDEVVGIWSDGRMGTIRGNRVGNYQFGAVVHREKSVQYVDISGCKKPFYASLLENVMAFFKTGQAPRGIDETLQIVRFIEAANQSRSTGEVEQVKR